MILGTVFPCPDEFAIFANNSMAICQENRHHTRLVLCAQQPQCKNQKFPKPMEKCPSIESEMAGRAESCKGCPNASICASSRPDSDIPVIKENLKSIKNIVAVISGKGGVGKSTIARNIATRVSKKGFNVLILDFDLSGPSIPRLTNTSEGFIYDVNKKFKPIKVDEGLSAVSIGHLEGPEDWARAFNTNAKNHVIKKILKLCDFSGVDVMVIDTPPNITDEHLALANYIKPNSAIAVTTPQRISLDDVIRQISFCRKTGIEILGLIENMKNFSCKKCGHINTIYADSNIEKFCSLEKIEYFGSLELKVSIAKESDCGNSVEDPIFDRIAHRIISSLCG